MAEPMLKLEGIHKRFGELEVLQGRRPRGRQRRSRLRPRAERLRQEHPAALRQPARAARGGRDLPRGPRHLQGPGLGHRRAELGARLRPPAGRDGLPAVQPLPPQDGAGERDDGAAKRCSASPRRRREAKGDGAARAGRPRRQARPVPRTALRRPAAAGRDRPGAGDGPARDALRRGHQRPRPRAGQGGARHDAGAGRGRDDDDRRHPRDRLRPRGRRPGRLHGRRRDRRAGQARRRCSTTRARSGPRSSSAWCWSAERASGRRPSPAG